MAYTFGDVREVYKRNVRFFQGAGLGHPKNSINIIPEHSDRIVDITPERVSSWDEKKIGYALHADAIFTTIRHQTLTVKPADCTTVFVYVELTDFKTLIGIIHSGWRGVDADLPTIAIEYIKKKYQLDPTQIHLAMLPHISKDHRTYENIDAFINLEKYASFMEKKGELYHFDEAGCALSQYQSAGVPGENIVVCDVDTYTEAQLGRTFSQKLNVDEKRLGKPTVEGRFLAAIAIR